MYVTPLWPGNTQVLTTACQNVHYGLTRSRTPRNAVRRYTYAHIVNVVLTLGRPDANFNPLTCPGVRAGPRHAILVDLPLLLCSPRLGRPGCFKCSSTSSGGCS